MKLFQYQYMWTNVSENIWMKLHEIIAGRVQLKSDSTQWCTGGEVKGKQVNGVGSQYSYTLPRNTVYPALLPTINRLHANGNAFHQHTDHALHCTDYLQLKHCSVTCQHFIMWHSNCTQCWYICYSAWLWPKMKDCTRPAASVGLTKFPQPTPSMALKTSAWGKMNLKPYMTSQEILWPFQFPSSNSGMAYTNMAPRYILHKADKAYINVTLRHVCATTVAVEKQ